jgi:serine/threonine-protein kinase
MSNDPRIQHLLDELFDTQRTPDEVCIACPDLLPEVRERWRRICRVEADLNAIFPPPPEPGASASAPLQTGVVLPNIPGYEVETVLGRGGMGIVFRARHVRLNRLVALKMVLAGAYAGPSERLRFQREAEAVAGLRHPNIVQIHDIGDSDGRPYFTMEYVEGGSLAQKLAGAPQPAGAAASLLAALASAVQAAHACGIVHRDLKPANVLLAADGTPKVSDFGLARRLDGEIALTRTGVAIGTPSYMAPEQARGQRLAGPAVDVYALGAILYEMLTGRPPFRAETAAETIQQVISQDPVPPSRLNTTVPRDLETICLKCLRKEPALRFVAAAALAEDLRRFLRGEAIAARPEGRLARLARHVRRRPALSAALTVVILLTVALVGGGAWTLSDREATARAASADQAATERAADADLTEMADFLKKSSWIEAKAAMERAKGRLGHRDRDSWEKMDLISRLDQGGHELKLAARLEAIRLRGFGGEFAIPQADKEYEVAFREARLGQIDEDPEAVAGRIQSSNIRNAIVAALDHWTVSTNDARRRAWVMDVAAMVDHEAPDWRRRTRETYRKADTWNDAAALAKLVDDVLAHWDEPGPAAASSEGPSVALLLALVQQVLRLPPISVEKNMDPILLMKRMQQAHPGDVWINTMLGSELMRMNHSGEAIGYFQAALAARPRDTAIHDHLALAFQRTGRPQECIQQLQLALRIEPTASTHQILALALSAAGRHEEAMQQWQLALAFGPIPALSHSVLGDTLEAKGRYAEAAAQYRQAVADDAKLAPAQKGLRTTLIKLRRWDEARDAWGKAIAAIPSDPDTSDGYAEFCLFLDQSDEYHRARRALLEQFGEGTEPRLAERIGRACLLAPVPVAEAQQAAALIERALADRKKSPDWVYPYFLFAKALAEYRLDRLDRATSILEGEANQVLRPAPQLVLAMVQQRRGLKNEARITLAQAVLSFDWRASSAENREAWIFHVLRREAERMILPDLPGYLEGKYQPRDHLERMTLLGVCQFTNRVHASAQLYAEAFDAAPRLVNDLRFDLRYKGACAAASAGCGRGTDAAGLEEAERMRWRKQARQWLRSSLGAWTKVLESDPAARDKVSQTLTLWQSEPDLACLREPTELLKLPAEERKDCLALWDEIGRAVKTSQKK